MSHPAVVQPCLDRAVARAGSIVQRAAACAVEALQADAQKREALHELQRRLPEWRTRYGEVLRRALDNPSAGQATVTVSPSSLTLALVDDSQIAQSIESTRLAQQIVAQVERPLAELDALMSSAFGCEGILPERNPLRPEVFAQALARLLGDDAPHP